MKHGMEGGPPKFRFEVVKFCRSALERQISEATRIALGKNCLNSKAGYNRSEVTRLTLKSEETPAVRRWTGGEASLDSEGLKAMMRRAEERGKAEQATSRKRGAGAEEKQEYIINKRASKKPRKLKYRRMEESWGVEDSGIREVEERELARTQFLHTDRTWATKIRVWTELEVLARKVIIDCLSIVISEAAENKIQAGRVNSSNWLETKEAE